MVDRNEDLLKMLNKAALFEESGVVILGNIYRTFVEEDKVSGLKVAEKERVIKILNELVEGAGKHGNLLRGLIDQISREGGQDAS